LRTLWSTGFLLGRSHHCESFTVATVNWLTVMEYLRHKWPRICSVGVITIRSCLRSWPVLEQRWHTKGASNQEVLIVPEHLSSPVVFSGTRVTRFVVFSVVFCRSVFVLLSVFFWSLYCLSFIDLLLLITSDYLFVIFKLFLMKIGVLLDVYHFLLQDTKL
jgi:hypothetical protein